ncbi:TauD/TfdA family dioxygenase [Myxococcus sp. AM001]|nr:TauD/TfdA family dioxygenase [Myxococcus sp. AM001]
MSTRVKDRPLLLTNEGRGCSGIPEQEVWDALAAHGVVLFRGFDVDSDGFYAFASRFNRGFLTSPFDDRKAAHAHNELQTVTLGRAGLSVHFEFGNMPLRPDLLWFYCRRPADQGMGGETLVVDGIALFEKLQPGTQQALRERRIKYRNYLPRHAMDAILTKNNQMQGMFGHDVMGFLHTRFAFHIVEDNAGRIVFDYTAPAVMPSAEDGRVNICQNILTDAYHRPTHQDAPDSFSTEVTWDDGAPIAADILQDLKTSASSLTRGIRWRAGDFVVVDNNRVLHGRNQTRDPLRDIIMLNSFSVRHPFLSAQAEARPC